MTEERNRALIFALLVVTAGLLTGALAIWIILAANAP